MNTSAQAKSMTTASVSKTASPWYREPWPWILMAGPAIVIVAGIITAWLALTSNDGLVVDDYYKKGLAAGETIAKSEQASKLGITAGVLMTREEMQIRLAAMQPLQMPSSIHVTLSHPTRAGMDQQAKLEYNGSEYLGRMLLPASGHWLVLIEDDARTWRLMGSVMLPAAKETVIGGGESAKPRS